MDPRISAALPRVRAYMAAQGHQQKDVVRLTGLTQPQVSKFLSGDRRRLTPAVIRICQYAHIEVTAEYDGTLEGLPLSQTARQLLVDNPRAAALVARLIDTLAPALAGLRDPALPAVAKETP